MNRKLQLIALVVSVGLLSTALANPVIPGRKQAKPIALVGGTVYTVTGEPIENGVVLFADGKITAVGRAGDVTIPANHEKIDCAGKRIYPSLIDGASQLGLTEIGQVTVTRDSSETGSVNPNAKTYVSVNPDSEHIPVTRANGILLAHIMPGGGLVSGQSAVIQLDGWTWEELTHTAPTGIVVNWPSMASRPRGFGQETPPEEQARARDDALRAIEDLFDEATRYRLALDAAGFEVSASAQVARAGIGEGEGKSAPRYDAKLEAMVPLLAGEVPMIVVANDSAQIQSAVAFAKRRGVKVIITGATEAGKIIPFLAEHQVPVIINGTQRMPSGRDEAYDEAYSLPARLHEAGVPFALTSNREPAFLRNLPYHVGNAIGFGLPEDAALACVTIAPAKILGIADRVGSLEVGKDATLFVADGDIFETPTHVTSAWIQGRPVNLTSRHTILNDKYKQRYGQE